jgi:hypothetical protein
MRTHGWLAAVATAIVPFLSLAAQGSSAVSGQVRDSAGKPVRGALITIPRLNLETRTDTSGAFAFARVPSGQASFLVRRMGFAPQTIDHLISGRSVDSLRFTLTAQPVELAPIVVSERDLRRQFFMAEFHRRRERGNGHFITREEILSRNTSRLSDVVRNVPGIRIMRVRGGSGVRFVSAATMRLNCAPMIWLDGQRAPGMEIDEITSSDVEGIELYSGPSQTPLRFSQNDQSTCGTILIWTRPPGSEVP